MNRIEVKSDNLNFNIINAILNYNGAIGGTIGETKLLNKDLSIYFKYNNGMTNVNNVNNNWDNNIDYIKRI